MMEESLYQHYRTLQRFLASTQRDEAAEGKPNRARDKLVRLSPIQFQELSTDVYDELMRRQAFASRQQNPNVPGIPDHLTPREGFHPKRNQARQKLSTLPVGRFRALATDVFYELERRVPRFAGGGVGRGGSPANGMRGPSRTGTPNSMRPGSREDMRRPQPRNGSLGGSMNGNYGPNGNGPMQKSSQSNTIVPNKSYLVEDDDDADGDSIYGISKRNTGNTNRSFGANDKIISDYQSKVEDLEGRIGGLERQLEDKSALIETLEERSQSRDQEATEVGSNCYLLPYTLTFFQASEGWSTLRIDLQSKLAEAEILNTNLQSEIDKAKDLHADKERNLREQLDMMATRSGEDEQWKVRHSDLMQQNQDLQQENQELQQDSQELQQELLEQQRVTDEVRREAAGFLAEMKALSVKGTGRPVREEELMQQVQSLEDQVAMWKGRFAQSKAQSRSAGLNLAVQPPTVEKDASLLQSDGLIKDVHVIEFQIAIDEAIRISRQDPKALLNQMKSVVQTVKHITEDFGHADDSDEKVARLVTRISGAACNFITATKNYVFSGGLSPVSLLDAAASHLSAAVVDAVHQVKMYPSDDASERDSVPSIVDKSAKYYSTNGRSSASESIYSSTTGPRASQSQYQNQYQASLNPRPLVTNGAPNGIMNGNAPSRNGPAAYNFEEHTEDLVNLKVSLSISLFLPCLYLPY